MGLDMFMRCSDEKLIKKVKEKAKPYAWFPTDLNGDTPVSIIQFDVSTGTVTHVPYQLREDIHEEELIAFWRKEDAVHFWFVEVVQHGVDDQGWYRVSFEQLCELRDCLREAIERIQADERFSGFSEEEKQERLLGVRYTIALVNAIESETMIDSKGNLTRPNSRKKITFDYGSWW